MERSSEAIFLALRQTLLASIQQVVPRGARVALVGYPRHTNVGDSAIWLGERRLFRQIGAKMVYFAELDYYSRDMMRRALGDGIVVIHGGGNIGDLWPNQEAFRERVMADFPDNAIVQMPQSIHFDDAANVARVRAAVAGHPRFTLFVRDRNSFTVARDRLGLDPILAPDMAFMLWPLKRVGHAAEPYIVQSRTDKERASDKPLADSFDWIYPPDKAERWMDRHLPEAHHLMRLGGFGVSAYGAWLDRLSGLRLRRGLRLLSRGEITISDRLHGVLLSLLAGIPVIALDNRIGKISALLETWLQDFPGLQIPPTVEEAMRIATGMRA